MLDENLYSTGDLVTVNIRWLWEQPSKQGAIKRLIREEIARKSENK